MNPSTLAAQEQEPDKRLYFFCLASGMPLYILESSIDRAKIKKETEDLIEMPAETYFKSKEALATRFDKEMDEVLEEIEDFRHYWELSLEKL